jgi:hypothetical protein
MSKPLTAVDTIISRPLWCGPNVISPKARLSVVYTWLEDCLLHHPNCRSLADESPPLPTRVIDVGPPDGSREPRLVISNGVHSAYMALSHCWGSNPTIKTTKDSLSERMQCIPMGSLPKTFQDAVTITRELGVLYLWIDSLCIVQDDEEDWSREAAEMASVYREARLTIAATSAKDSTAGCLTNYESPLRIDFPTRSLTRDASSTVDGTSRGCLRLFPSEYASLRRAPLNQRAWVLQESVLSRRTIHLARDQFYWHCLCRVASEDGVMDGPADSTRYSSYQLQRPSMSVVLRRPDVSLDRLYNCWLELIEDYSTRSMTKREDVFAALAGLTSFFRERVDDEPLAGLWKRDLHVGLLWTTRAKVS